VSGLRQCYILEWWGDVRHIQCIVTDIWYFVWEAVCIWEILNWSRDFPLTHQHGGYGSFL
jgi:hypothetical protein